tara:strand:- start:873 stop:1895 length:1023 start_codon:yes stop_codon:yes gene_type:complete
MAAIRITESSGSVGVIQSSNLFGGFEPTNILFNTASGGLQTGLSLGTDTALFISGAIGSKNSLNVGVSVFGGDLVVSGTLYAERQVIEVDEVASGHLLVSGNLEVQDSISANSAKIMFLSGGAASSTDEGSYPDVNFFVSGSKNSQGSAVRGTALFGGDVVISGTLHGGSPLKIGGGMQVVGNTMFDGPMTFNSTSLFCSGFEVEAGLTTFQDASTFSSGLSGSLTKLPNGTSFIKQAGSISVVTQSNGSLEISSPNFIFNEYLGTGSNLNTFFTLLKTPTESKNISIYLNGLLQMPATAATGAPYQDYSITGSNIFFTTSSIPGQGSIIMANYTTNESN